MGMRGLAWAESWLAVVGSRKNIGGLLLLLMVCGAGCFGFEFLALSRDNAIAFACVMCAGYSQLVSSYVSASHVLLALTTSSIISKHYSPRISCKS